MNNLIDRITEYLAAGGLFNPELMDHAEVQRLLIDVRDYLIEQKKSQFDIPYIPSNPFRPVDAVGGTGCRVCGLSGMNGLVCTNQNCPTKVSC